MLAPWNLEKIRKYFNKNGRGTGNDSFFGKISLGEELVEINLASMQDIKIKRHLKVRANANPYDPEYSDYFKKRGTRKLVWNHWYHAPLTAA